MRKSLHLCIIAIVLLSIAGSAMAANAATPAPAAGVVNINTADASQLSMLPRVGLKAAQRIVDYRHEHGQFKKTSDLMQVKGFGEKSFARISHYLTVDGKTTLAGKIKSLRKPRTPKASKPTSASK